MYPNVVFVRCVWITLFVLVLVWIEEYMGGFDSSPEDTGPDRNDTSRLFNWHPFLMILAFPVFMTEAIFTYTALPGVLLRRQAHPPMLDDSGFTLTVCSRRDLRKIVHAVLQTLVLLAMLFGLIAVFRSHTEKKPRAMDDLYSPHSYMGICTMAFFVLQVRPSAPSVRLRWPACAVSLWHLLVCPSDPDAFAEGLLCTLSSLLRHGSVSHWHGHDHGRPPGEVDVQSEGRSAHQFQGILRAAQRHPCRHDASHHPPGHGGDVSERVPEGASCRRRARPRGGPLDGSAAAFGQKRAGSGNVVRLSSRHAYLTIEPC